MLSYWNSLVEFLNRLEESKIIRSERISSGVSAMPFCDSVEEEREEEITYYECTSDAIELTAKLLHYIDGPSYTQEDVERMTPKENRTARITVL